MTSGASAGRRSVSSRRRSSRASGSSDRGQRRGFLLKVVEGPSIGKEHVFEREATIGRVEGNSIVLLESGVSRQHSRVHLQHGVYVLEDLGSANGTLLNGERIAALEVLREGDHVTVSQTTFQFSSLDTKGGEATKEVAIRGSALNAIDAAATRESSTLWGSRRVKISLAVAVTLIALGVTAYMLFGRDGKGIVFDQSDEPLSYAEELFEGTVFGYGEYDRKHRKAVIVEFKYRGGRVTLQYGAWGVDKVGELVIMLNGSKVGQVPVTMDRWVYGLKITLPRDKLNNKEANRLVFDNTRNPPRADPWEIYDLRLIQEAIPPPDTKEAYRHYELAKQAWMGRHVEPGNLYKALVHLKRARDYLEGLSQKPELYGHTLSFIAQVEKALTQLFEEGLFTARRLIRVGGDLSAARRVLLRTLRYFRKDDYRYRELQRFLKTVEQDLENEE